MSKILTGAVMMSRGSRQVNIFGWEMGKPADRDSWPAVGIYVLAAIPADSASSSPLQSIQATLLAFTLYITHGLSPSTTWL